MTKIQIITPAPPGSLSGNRATATRWGRLIEAAGYEVSIGEKSTDAHADVLIALHAWRSASAVNDWKCMGKPLILALTGTDIYRFQYSHPEVFYASLDAADQLICLHALVKDGIPEKYHHKLHIVYQSATPAVTYHPLKTPFRLCVVGHLREEKDPFRAEEAVTLLPETWPLRVTSLGKAHDDSWAVEAKAREEKNPRYQWLGEIPHDETARIMAGSQLMVMSSIMEGGANVVSEACRMGLPILASDIPGNIGLLGEAYAGYYPVRDTRALADLIRKCYEVPDFLHTLHEQVTALSERFLPKHEQTELIRVINLALRQTA